MSNLTRPIVPGPFVVLVRDQRPDGAALTGRLLGTGMHGGVIYLRGDVRDDQMGREISRVDMDETDRHRLAKHVTRFAEHFDLNAAEILDARFTKLAATSSRPYGRLYVY